VSLEASADTEPEDMPVRTAPKRAKESAAPPAPARPTGTTAKPGGADAGQDQAQAQAGAQAGVGPSPDDYEDAVLGDMAPSGDSTMGVLHQYDLLEDNDDDDDEHEHVDMEDDVQFVAVDTLERCVYLIAQIKHLYSKRAYVDLVDLLRKKVANLLVTEDDLRRTGFGKVLTQLLRHGKDDEVQRVAAEIITEWRTRVSYRDVDAARETEQERIERIKFEEYMDLPAVSLTVPENMSMGRQVVYVESLQPKSHQYEKEATLVRASVSKPFGFELNIKSLAGGKLRAFVSHIEDNIATCAGPEGRKLELNDEVLAVDGKLVSAMTRPAFLRKLKTKKLPLRLLSYVAGAEKHDDYSTEDQALYRFLRVSAGDLVPIDDDGGGGMSAV